MESRWWNAPDIKPFHTCDQGWNDPCLACCGSIEAYQEACGVPEHLRGTVPRKPLTKEEEEQERAKLKARFKAHFGETGSPETAHSAAKGPDLASLKANYDTSYKAWLVAMRQKYVK